MSRIQDAIAVLRGIIMIANAGAKIAEKDIKRIWLNSSVKELFEIKLANVKNCGDKIAKNPTKELNDFMNDVRETAQRVSVVAEGVKQYSRSSSVAQKQDEQTVKVKTDLVDGLDVASITLKELQKILSQRNEEAPVEKVDPIKMEVARLDPSAFTKDEKYVQEWMSYIAKHDSKSPDVAQKEVPKNVENDKIQQQEKIQVAELSSVAKQRKVPSSRISRLASFGTLFAGLGLGTVNELTKGALGLGGSKNLREALLSPSNAERIVDTLCKVRGAALKIGQILSIQDSNVVSPELAKAFERVRQAADYMPDWQVERVMSSELGADWRNKMQSFDEKPFAAASIGQVHRAVYLDGTEVAIKIQYPGVAKSIESDIDNLVSMLKVWDVFPPGIFIDNVVKVAKRELAWEVDYIREAEYTHNVGLMLAKYPEYKIPKVIRELTTKSVLCTELVPGIPVDKCFELP